MPTRRDAHLSHARRFVDVLVELNTLDGVSDDVRASRLNELEDVWLQVSKARDWALHNAASDGDAERIAQTLEDAGVEIAEIRAETRTALRQLSELLLPEKDNARH